MFGRGFIGGGGGSVAATTPIVINAMDINRESAYSNQMRDLQNEVRQLRMQMPQFSSSIDDEARSVITSVNSTVGGGGAGAGAEEEVTTAPGEGEGSSRSIVVETPKTSP